MNILFLSFNQEGKGSFLRAFALAKALSKLGHQLTICSASVNNAFEDKERDGVRLVGFPWGRRFLFGYNLCEVLARKKWLANQQYDIVHAFDLRPSCSYPALQAQSNGAVFVSDWADWFGKGGSVEERSNPFVRAILRPIETYYERSIRLKASGTTVICNALLNLGLDIGIPRNNLCLLPNGFDQKIEPKATKTESRRRLGLDIEKPLVGSLGAFFQKDFELLQQASHFVKAQQDVDFLHIGQKPKGSSFSELAFSGRLSDEDLSLHLQACDILLLPMADLPANHGRLPLKFSDYLSAGRPILATNIGDVADYINKFDTGFIAQPDAKSFAATLLEALGNPEKRAKTGENAQKLSKQVGYRWQDQAQDLQDFYITIQDQIKSKRII